MANPSIQNDPVPGRLLGNPSITVPQPNAEPLNIESRSDPDITRLRWSQTESHLSRAVEACFTIENGKVGEQGAVEIYRGEEKIGVISFELSEKAEFLDMRVPWIPVDSASVPQSEMKDQMVTYPADHKPKKDLYRFKVSMGGHRFHDPDLVPLSLQKTIHLKPVYANGEPLPPGMRIRWQLPSGEWKESENVAEVFTLEELELGQYLIQVISGENPDHPLEILDRQLQHPFPFGMLTVRSLKETDQTVLLPILPPFAGVDIREDSPTWSATKPCSDFVIDSLKRYGENVTLFLHGYNVPRGQWGYYYDALIETETPAPTVQGFFAKTSMYQGQSTGIPCTVYRDNHSLVGQFPEQASFLTEDSSAHGFDPLEKALEPITKNPIFCMLHSNLCHREEGAVATLNGTEGRRWGIEMERNLNRAAGWDEKDYQTYSRMMPVLWSGDHGALNFMEAVTHTAKAGKRLATLIRYLHDQGIPEINVIAHSLGNEALLVAMHELGKENQCYLNHVFLWEPAVPQDALSTIQRDHSCKIYAFKADPEVTQEERGRALWYNFPKAYQAAHKIIILSSQNDNILGPLLSTDACNQLQLNRHDIFQSKPWSEFLTAIIMTEFHIESAFELATWSRANPLDLFKTQKQDDVYTMFRYAHCGEKCRSTGALLKETLNAQIEDLERSNHLPAIVQGKQTSSLFAFPDIADKLANWEKYTSEFIQIIEHINRDFADRLNIPFWLIDGVEIIAVAAAAAQLWEFLTSEGILCAVNKTIEVEQKTQKVKKMIHYHIDHDQFLKPFKRFLYLFHILFNEFPYRPMPAMGYKYSKEDIDDPPLKRLYGKGNLVPVDQTRWLWSHSGMMEPSKELMQHVYVEKIWKESYGYHFGKHKRPEEK